MKASTAVSARNRGPCLSWSATKSRLQTAFGPTPRHAVDGASAFGAVVTGDSEVTAPPRFLRNVAEHRLVERELGHHLLQPGVLLLQELELPHLVGLQPRVLLLPA